MPSAGAEQLAHALDRQEIVPYFQPQVELRSNRIVGFEALARWLRSGVTVACPADFIPLAERSGLIRTLSESLLGQACAAAATWPAGVRLSINMPPSLMHEALLPERLQEITERAGLPLHRLSLEITEATMLDDLEVARPIFERVRSLGVQIALDDFGTGYSGLRRLLMLRFDTIKIDRVFIEAMATKREASNIVAAIVRLCGDLGVTSVAEGVERQQQAEQLRSMGCEIGQGWLFGRPMAMATAAERLATG
jgi:EAL domain-containing protein (putative c-di-GMP-specific phosphodiesterase class I)